MSPIYNTPEARREEVQAALKVINGYITEIKETVAEIENPERTGARSIAKQRDLILQKLSDLVDISRDAREEYSVYLVTQHNVSREQIARSTGVSNMTVGRWVKRITEPEEASE